MARVAKNYTDAELKRDIKLHQQSDNSLKTKTLSIGGGLQLKIKPNGTTSWYFSYYRPLDKKRTLIALGKYPLISLSQARQKTLEAAGLLVQGIDPQIFRDKNREEQIERIAATFGSVASKWYELKLQKVSETTARKAYERLHKHVLADMKNIPISELRPKHFIKQFEPIQAKGHLEIVKRLCQSVNEIMRLAVAAGQIEMNPLSDLTKLFPAPQRKNQPSIKPEQLPNFIHALARAQISIVTRCLIEWQLHTITRPNEAATAEWNHIDLEKKLWILPLENTKMRREHTIPLTNQMLAILKIMQPISGHRPYVFPGHRDPKKHASSQTANMAIKRMGFKGELVAHGLRSLASTTLNEQGFDPDVIETCLAHVDRNAVRRAYNRADYIEQRRKVMQWWSDHIEQASYGNLSITGTKHLKAI